MFHRRVEFAAFAVAALVFSFTVIGCSGKASVRQEKARALAGSTPRPTVAGLAKASEHLAKAAPRDSAIAKYYDPDYGVTLRYPRNLVLLESAGDDPDRDADSDRVISWEQAKQAGAGVRTAEELGADDAGAALLATIWAKRPFPGSPLSMMAGGGGAAVTWS